MIRGGRPRRSSPASTRRCFRPSSAGVPSTRPCSRTFPNPSIRAAKRGEFHTFVWDGPDFSSPIEVEIGEIVPDRDGFVFRDVVPKP